MVVIAFKSFECFGLHLKIVNMTDGVDEITVNCYTDCQEVPPRKHPTQVSPSKTTWTRQCRRR